MRAAGFLFGKNLVRCMRTNTEINPCRSHPPRNYALRAAKSQDQKEAAELLSKAILELALAIETTEAKVKKINKSS